MKYLPPKGTQDLWGKQFYAYDSIAKTILRVTEQYGFRQIRTPGFEPLNVMVKDAGSEVAGQIYTFRDKGGRDMGIKSDITPAVTRFMAGNGRSMSWPIKVVCSDRVYRYESPQAGRNREITQINAEMFGAKPGASEAEMIACLYQCYAELGLPEVIINVGYRPLLESYVRVLGIEDGAVLPMIRLIDKKDKITPEAFASQAKLLGVDRAGLAKVQMLMGLEGPLIKTIAKAKTVLADQKDLMIYIKELQDVADRLDAYGIAKQCQLNLGLARGSDYYTGVIIEAKMPNSGFGSIGGGGRYDNLVADYGGPDMPAVGWSIGLDRLYLILEEFGRLQEVSALPALDYYLATERDQQSVKAMIAFAKSLRAQNKSVELDLGNKNMSEQLQSAKELGVSKVAIFKQKDVSRGFIKVLDLVRKRESRQEITGIGSE